MGTISLVQTYLDAFNRGDNEAMLACLQEDVVHDINEGGREIGKDRFRQFNATMTQHYKEQLQDIVILVSPDQTHAAAEFTVVGEYLRTAEGLPTATGQSYRLPAGIFFEVANGLISRVTTYYNLADWTAQVAGS